MRISICTLVSLINVLHNSLIFGKFPTGRFFFLLIYEFTASISLLLAEFVLVLMITGQFDHWEWLRSVLKKSKFSKLPKIGQNIPSARLFERLEYASPNPNDDIYKVKSTFSYVLTCFQIIWQSKEPKKLMLLCILILWPLFGSSWDHRILTSLQRLYTEANTVINKNLFWANLYWLNKHVLTYYLISSCQA